MTILVNRDKTTIDLGDFPDEARSYSDPVVILHRGKIYMRVHTRKPSRWFEAQVIHTDL